MTRILFAVAAATALGATSALAQGDTTAVAPGMREAQVRARWGEPVLVRRLGEWTYLFYDNGCLRECGHHDVVFLQDAQVVDAIVRAPWHRYSGHSSSPGTRAPVFTPPDTPPEEGPGGPGAPGGPRGVVRGVRING